MASPLAQVQHALRELGANGSIVNRPSPFTFFSSSSLLSSSSEEKEYRSSSSSSSSSSAESAADQNNDHTLTSIYPSLRTSVWKSIIQAFRTTFIPHKYIKKVNEELLYGIHLLTIFLQISSTTSTTLTIHDSAASVHLTTQTTEEFTEYLQIITLLCNQYAGIFTLQDFNELIMYGNRTSNQDNTLLSSATVLPSVLLQSTLPFFPQSSSSLSTGITTSSTLVSGPTNDSLTESSIRVSGGTQLVRLDDIIPLVQQILYLYSNLSNVQLDTLRNNYLTNNNNKHRKSSSSNDSTVNNASDSSTDYNYALCPVLNLVIVVISLLLRSLRIQGKTSKKIFHLCFNPIKNGFMVIPETTITGSSNTKNAKTGRKDADTNDEELDDDNDMVEDDSTAKNSQRKKNKYKNTMEIDDNNQSSSLQALSPSPPWESTVQHTGLINLLLYARDKCLHDIDTIQRTVQTLSNNGTMFELSEYSIRLQQLTTALMFIEQVTESIIFAIDVIPQYNTAIPRAFMVAQEATFNKHIVYGNKDIKVTTSTLSSSNTGSKYSKKSDPSSSSSSSQNTLALYRVPVISTERKLFDSFVEAGSSSSSSSPNLSTVIVETYGIRALPYLLASYIRYTRLYETTSFDNTIANATTNVNDGRKKRKGDDSNSFVSPSNPVTNTSSNALPLTSVSTLQNNSIFAFATELISLCLGYNETEAETRLQKRTTSVFQSFTTYSTMDENASLSGIRSSDDYYRLAVRIRSVTALLTILAESQGYNIHDDTHPNTLTAILEAVYRWLTDTLDTLQKEWSNDWEIFHAPVIPHAITIMHAAIGLSTVLFELNHTIITAAPHAVELAKNYNLPLFLSKYSDQSNPLSNENKEIDTYLHSLYTNPQYATSFDMHGLGTISLLVTLLACYQQIPTFIANDGNDEEDDDDSDENDTVENDKNDFDGIDCGKLRSEVTVSFSTLLANIVSIYSRLRAMDTLFHVYHIITLYFQSSECWCANEFSTNIWLSDTHVHAIGTALRNLPAGQVWDIGTLLINNLSHLSITFYTDTKQLDSDNTSLTKSSNNAHNKNSNEDTSDDDTFLTAALIIRQQCTFIAEYLRQLGPNNANALRCLHKALQTVYGSVTYLLVSVNNLVNNSFIRKMANISDGCLDLLITGTLQMYLAAIDVTVLCGSYSSVTSTAPTTYPNDTNQHLFSTVSELGNDILWPFNLYRNAVETVGVPINEGPEELRIKEDKNEETVNSAKSKSKSSSSSKGTKHVSKVTVFPSFSDSMEWTMVPVTGTEGTYQASVDTQEQGLLMCAARLRLLHTLYEMAKSLNTIDSKPIYALAKALTSTLLRNPSYITASVLEICLPYAASTDVYFFTMDLMNTNKEQGGPGFSSPYRVQTLQDARFYELPLLAAYSSRCVGEHLMNTVMDFLNKFTKDGGNVPGKEGKDIIISLDSTVYETVLRSIKNNRKHETIPQLLDIYNQADANGSNSSTMMNCCTTVNDFTTNIYTPLINFLRMAQSLPLVGHEYSAMYTLRNDTQVDTADNNAHCTILSILNLLAVVFKSTVSGTANETKNHSKSKKKGKEVEADTSSPRSVSTSLIPVISMFQSLQELSIRYFSTVFSVPSMITLCISSLEKNNLAPLVKFSSSIITMNNFVASSIGTTTIDNDDTVTNFISTQAKIVTSALEALELGQSTNDKKLPKAERKQYVTTMFTTWLTEMYPVISVKEGNKNSSTPKKNSSPIAVFDQQGRILHILSQAIIRWIKNQAIDSLDKYVLRGIKHSMDTLVTSLVSASSNFATSEVTQFMMADLFECILLLTLYGKEAELSTVDITVITWMQSLLTNNSVSTTIKSLAQVSTARVLQLYKDTNMVIYTTLSQQLLIWSIVQYYLQETVLPVDNLLAHIPIILVSQIGISFSSSLQRKNESVANTTVTETGKILSFVSQLIHIASRNYDNRIFSTKDKVPVGSIDSDTIQDSTQTCRDTLVTLFRTILTLLSSSMHTFLDTQNTYASSKPLLALITFLQSITTNPRFIPLTVADFNLILLLLSSIVQYGSLQIRVTSAFHSTSSTNTTTFLSSNVTNGHTNNNASSVSLNKKRNMKHILDQSINVDTMCIDLGGVWKSNTVTSAVNFDTNDDDAVIVASGSYYGNQVYDMVQSLNQRQSTASPVLSVLSSSSSSGSIDTRTHVTDSSIFNDQTLQGCGWILYALMKHHGELSLASMSTIATILSTALNLAFTPIHNTTMQNKLGRIGHSDGYPNDAYLNSLIRCCELFARQVRVARYHAVQVLARLLDILTIIPLVNNSTTEIHRTTTLPTRIRAIISPGLFALLDVCSTRELQQLYSLLHYRTNARSFLKTLHKEYENTYKYTGKV